MFVCMQVTVLKQIPHCINFILVSLVLVLSLRRSKVKKQITECKTGSSTLPAVARMLQIVFASNASIGLCCITSTLMFTAFGLGQGSHQFLKVLGFISFIFQAWKVLEKR